MVSSNSVFVFGCFAVGCTFVFKMVSTLLQEYDKPEQVGCTFVFKMVSTLGKAYKHH